MIEEKLNALRSAIDADDQSQTTTVHEELMLAYEEHDPTAKAVEEVAVELHAHENEELAASAMEYLSLIPEVRDYRIEMHHLVYHYLIGEAPASDASAVVSAMIDAEKALEELVSTIKNEITMSQAATNEPTTTIPAILSLVGPSRMEVPKGTMVDEDLVITNHGQQPATNVALSLETELDLQLSSDGFSSLDGGTTETVTLSGTPTTIGLHEWLVRVDGSDTRVVQDGQIATADRESYLQKASTQIDGLLVAVRESKQNAPGSGGGLNDIENKLKTANKRLNAIEADLDDEPVYQINDRMAAVTNLLNTIPQHAQNLPEHHIPAGKAALLSREATAIVETTERGIDAER